MDVTPIPSVPEPVIDWTVPNVVTYVRAENGLILFINETTMSTETDFLALCILNTSSLETYIPGRLYPGLSKNLVTLYDGQVTLNN